MLSWFCRTPILGRSTEEKRVVDFGYANHTPINDTVQDPRAEESDKKRNMYIGSPAIKVSHDKKTLTSI
jgi:hypothetical protein